MNNFTDAENEGEQGASNSEPGNILQVSTGSAQIIPQDDFLTLEVPTYIEMRSAMLREQLKVFILNSYLKYQTTMKL